MQFTINSSQLLPALQAVKVILSENKKEHYQEDHGLNFAMIEKKTDNKIILVAVNTRFMTVEKLEVKEVLPDNEQDTLFLSLENVNWLINYSKLHKDTLLTITDYQDKNYGYALTVNGGTCFEADVNKEKIYKPEWKRIFNKMLDMDRTGFEAHFASDLFTKIVTILKTLGTRTVFIMELLQDRTWQNNSIAALITAKERDLKIVAMGCNA